MLSSDIELCESLLSDQKASEATSGNKKSFTVSYIAKLRSPPCSVTAGAKHTIRVRFLLFFVPFISIVSIYAVWIRHNMLILNITVLVTLLVVAVWPLVKHARLQTNEAAVYWFEDSDLSELMVQLLGVMYMVGALFFAKKPAELVFILFGPVPAYWMPWGVSSVMENSWYVRGTSIFVACKILIDLGLQMQGQGVASSQVLREGAACLFMHAAVCVFIRDQLVRASVVDSPITAARLKRFDSSDVKQAMLRMHAMGPNAVKTTHGLEKMAFNAYQEGARFALMPIMALIQKRRQAKQELLGIWFFVYDVVHRNRLSGSEIECICDFLPALSEIEWRVASLRDHEPESTCSGTGTHSLLSSVTVVRHRLMRVVRQCID